MSYDPLRPLTPRQLRRQAELLLKAAYARPKSQIRRAQEEARMQAQQDAQMIQGFTEALAKVIGQTAPGVGGAYSDAANRTRIMGQGVGAGQTQAEQAAADQANALLAKQGGGRTITAGPAGTVTGYLGGTGPAAGFQSTGQALGGYAAMLPGIAAGRGQEQVAARLSKGQEEQAKFRAQMEDLMARAPDELAKIIHDLQGQEISKQATAVQRSYLGVSQYNAATNRQKAQNQLTIAEQKAAAASGKNASKQAIAARKARLAALQSAHEKVYTLAEKLHQQGGGIDPNTLKPIPKITRQQAFTHLYQRYGRPLERYAPKGARSWWIRQIRAMIIGALDNSYGPKTSKKGQAPAGARGPVG